MCIHMCIYIYIYRKCSRFPRAQSGNKEADSGAASLKQPK